MAQQFLDFPVHACHWCVIIYSILVPLRRANKTFHSRNCMGCCSFFLENSKDANLTLLSLVFAFCSKTESFYVSSIRQGTASAFFLLIKNLKFEVLRRLPLLLLVPPGWRRDTKIRPASTLAPAEGWHWLTVVSLVIAAKILAGQFQCILYETLCRLLKLFTSCLTKST